MARLTCTERLSRTFRGEEIDRVATFDIIHNIELIEYVTQQTLTPGNAEGLLCQAAAKLLDMIRHFAIPRDLTPRMVRDETGFVYQYDWWTGHLVERPQFHSTRDIEASLKKDMDIIYDSVEKKRVCRIARQHARLFDEQFETFEEVKSEFERITRQLDGTVMLPPEDVSALAVATERYDETGWWYVYYDHPQTASRYLDALTDYQLCFIDAFADSSVCPFAQISVAVGTSTGLLYSPDLLRQEVIPREKRKIERWKEHGYYVMAFLDGYKWPIIDDFLALGVDEIHPCEPYCQMDVSSFREKYPEVVLGQPIDCRELLPHGTKAEVKQAVIDAIEDAGCRKIIIGSTSEIHPGVNVENAMTMYETARTYPL